MIFLGSIKGSTFLNSSYNVYIEYNSKMFNINTIFYKNKVLSKIIWIFLINTIQNRNSSTDL